MIAEGPIICAAPEAAPFELAPGAAGAEVFATQPFMELLVTVDHPPSSFHLRFRWESFPALAGSFGERAVLRRIRLFSLRPPLLVWLILRGGGLEPLDVRPAV